MHVKIKKYFIILIALIYYNCKRPIHLLPHNYKTIGNSKTNIKLFTLITKRLRHSIS